MTGKKSLNRNGTSLDALVQQYVVTKEHGPALDAYLKFFKKRTLVEAIERAGFSIDGKVHGHQRRVGKEKLERASKALFKNIDKLEACRSFEELHELIADCTKHIHPFGVLARYDISLRIGANLGLWPEIVYLHAGTKKGCKKLGVKFKRTTVEMSALPKAVQRLKPYHAENFLCIYKDGFGRVGDASIPSRPC